MLYRFFLLAVFPILLSLVAGCQEKRIALKGDNTALMTDAASRLVLDRPVPGGANQRLVCSEPSPDIAKALSTALALSASAKTPKGIEASADYNRVSTEAITILTGRSEAVVALRDGLFKACEAYANNVIAPEAYQLILSQYGDLLVTLMLGEAAAAPKSAEGSPQPAVTNATDSGTPPAKNDAAQKPPAAATQAKLKAALDAVAKAQAMAAGAARSAAIAGALADEIAAANSVVKEATAASAAPMPAKATASATDPISTIYKTYYENAQTRMLQAVFVSCVAPVPPAVSMPAGPAVQPMPPAPKTAMQQLCAAFSAQLARAAATAVLDAAMVVGNGQPRLAARP